MAPNTPSAAPEASSEVVDTAVKTEQTLPVDAAFQAIEQQRQGTVVGTAVKTEELAQEVQEQIVASADAPAAGGAPTPETDSTAKAGFLAGSLSWLSKQFEGITKLFTDTGSTFGKWLKKMMGIKEKDPGEDVASEERSDEPEISTEVEGEDLLTPDDATGLLEVASWDEVMAIEDLPTRVLQAALYANSINMDCFTKGKKGELQNHCSGWCESVFQKAGLDLYDPKPRLYCNYKNWPSVGTMQGLELQPGDSIIRHNGNAATGDHQEIILSSYGPDEDGDYQIITVGQTSVKGKSGIRKIRSMIIHSKDIKVVIRPGATQPFEGENPSVS